MSKYKLYALLLKAQKGQEATNLIMLSASTFAESRRQAKRDGVFLALDMWPVKEGWGFHVCAAHEIDTSWYKMRKVQRSELFTDNIEGGTDGEFSLVEELAAYAHDAWSRWMKYLFGKSHKDTDGSVIIPADYVENLSILMDQEYGEMPERSKESDRKEARRIISKL
jgi:hypothetical protein